VYTFAQEPYKNGFFFLQKRKALPKYHDEKWGFFFFKKGRPFQNIMIISISLLELIK